MTSIPDSADFLTTKYVLSGGNTGVCVNPPVPYNGATIPVKTLFTGTYSPPDVNSDITILAFSGRSDPTGSVLIMAAPSDIANLDPIFSSPNYGPNYDISNIGIIPVNIRISPDQSVLDRSSALSPITSLVSVEPLQRSGGQTDLAGLTTAAVVAQIPDRAEIANSTILAATSGNGHLKQGMITGAAVLAFASPVAPETVPGPYVRVGPWYSQKVRLRLFNDVDYNFSPTPFTGGTVLTVPLAFESRNNQLGVPNMYKGPVRIAGTLNFDASFLVAGANATFSASVGIKAFYYRNDVNLTLQRFTAESEISTSQQNVAPGDPTGRKFIIPVDTTLLNGFDEGETSCPGVLLGLSMVVSLGRLTNSSGPGASVATQILNSIQGSLSIEYYDQKDTTNLNVGYIAITGGYKGAINLRVERTYATRPDEKDITLFRDQAVYCMDQSRIDKLSYAIWLMTRSGSGLAFLGSEWRGYLALLSDSKTFYSLVRQSIENPNRSLIDFRVVDDDEGKALEAIKTNGLESTLTPYQAMSPFWNNLLSVGKKAALAGLRAAVGSVYTSTPRYGSMQRYGSSGKYNCMEKEDQGNEVSGPNIAPESKSRPEPTQHQSYEHKVIVDSKHSVSIQLGDNKDTTQYCTINAKVGGRKRSRYYSMDVPSDLLTQLAETPQQPSLLATVENRSEVKNIEPIAVIFHPPGTGFVIPHTQDGKSPYKAMDLPQFTMLDGSELQGDAKREEPTDSEEEQDEEDLDNPEPEEQEKSSSEDLTPIVFRDARLVSPLVPLKVTDQSFSSFAQIGHTKHFYSNKSWLKKTQADNSTRTVPRTAWFGFSVPVSTAYFPVVLDRNELNQKGQKEFSLLTFQLGFTFVPMTGATYEEIKFDVESKSTRLTLHVDTAFQNPSQIGKFIYDYHMAANDQSRSRWSVFKDGEAHVYLSVDTQGAQKEIGIIEGKSNRLAIVCALTGMPPITNVSGVVNVYRNDITFMPAEYRHKILGYTNNRIDYKLTQQDQWTRESIMGAHPLLMVKDEAEPELIELLAHSRKIGAPSGIYTIAAISDEPDLIEFFATYEQALFSNTYDPSKGDEHKDNHESYKKNIEFFHLGHTLTGLKTKYEGLVKEYKTGGSSSEKLREAALDAQANFNNQLVRYKVLLGAEVKTESKAEKKALARRDRVLVLAMAELKLAANQFVRVQGATVYPGVETWRLKAKPSTLPTWTARHDEDWKAIKAAVNQATPLTIFKTADQALFSAATKYYKFIMAQIRTKEYIPKGPDKKALETLCSKDYMKYGVSYAIGSAVAGVFIWNSTTSMLAWIPNEQGVTATKPKPRGIARVSVQDANAFIMGGLVGDDLGQRRAVNVLDLSTLADPKGGPPPSRKKGGGGAKRKE